MSDVTALKKQRAASAALRFLRDDMILGIGTGTTVSALIDLLAPERASVRLRAAVSSSEASSAHLRRLGITVLDLNDVLNDVSQLPLYVDGADEATRERRLIKGGGAALTREKILAAAAERFICIIDEGKLVDKLGRFPLPIEVIPMARSYVARRLSELGGRPVWRQGVITDNGNHILDVHELSIDDPLRLESTINQVAGVVSCGLFAARGADLLLVGTADGVEQI